jgi:hypothetical protein
MFKNCRELRLRMGIAELAEQGNVANGPRVLRLFRYLANINSDLDAGRLKEIVGSLLNLTYAVADDEAKLNDEVVFRFQYSLHLTLAILSSAEDGCLTPSCISKLVNVLRRVGELASKCVDECSEIVLINEELRSMYEHEQSCSSYWRF